MADAKKSAKVPAQEYSESGTDAEKTEAKTRAAEYTEPKADSKSEQLEWRLNYPAPATVWKDLKTGAISYERPEFGQSIVKQGTPLSPFTLQVLKAKGIAP